MLKGLDARFVKYMRGHVPQYDDDLATKGYVDKKDGYIEPRLVRDSDTTLGVNEAGLIIIANTQDVIITLPALSDFTIEDHLHTYIIDKVAGVYDVIIQTQGGDTFTYGNTEFHLGNHLWSFSIHGSSKGFMLARNITVDTRLAYTGTAWASSNFTTATKVPLDTIIHEDPSGLVDWRDATKDIEVLTAGSFLVDFTINFESLTNPAEWSILAGVYKNGVIIDEITISQSGFKAGIMTVVSPSKSVDCVSGDILDLRVSSATLAGQLNNAYFNVAIRL